MQKLSIEYARLIRENERLRAVMQSAVSVLQDSNNKEFKRGLATLYQHKNERSLFGKVPSLG